jgi:hypothetical protein
MDMADDAKNNVCGKKDTHRWHTDAVRGHRTIKDWPPRWAANHT